jgi:hypothetical protein
MFARIVEFFPKPELKEELIRVVKSEVLPILQKQPGFLEILPFVPENTVEKALTITFWSEKRYAEAYEKNVFPKVTEIMRPYLTSAVTLKYYTVETSIPRHFVESLAA